MARAPSSPAPRTSSSALGAWLFALALVPSLAHTAAAGDDPAIPAEPAKARLVADTQAFAPGSTFRLGVLFTIDPHWHVYWHSARDGGLGTEVTWKLPEGWSAGPVEWPAPSRYVLPGPLVAYGYEKEVLLSSEITVPAGFTAAEPVTLAAELSWLVCRDFCVIGKGEPTLALPAGAVTPSADAPRFAHWRARVPVPAHRAMFTVEGSFERSGGSGTWRVALVFPEGVSPPDAKQIRAFPFDPPGGRLDEGKMETDGSRLTVVFQVEITGADFRPERLAAVLTWPAAEGGDRPPVAVEVRSRAPPAEKSSTGGTKSGS